MVSQAYNLLWIAPTFVAADAREEPFREPIPTKTVENMLSIAARNPTADVRLWVDSKRLTKAQMSWLQEIATSCPSGNMSIQDLRTIPAYNQHPLFNQPDTSPNWRSDKHSLIWRQVDTARILACLQGNYDQSFYSDADITNLNVNSEEVQQQLARHGVILSCVTAGGGGIGFENGLFGFNKSRRGIFDLLYIETLRNVVNRTQNGYQTLIDFFNFNSEVRRLGINKDEIGFEARYDGTCALHPAQQSNASLGSFTGMLARQSRGSWAFRGGERTEPTSRKN